MSENHQHASAAGGRWHTPMVARDPHEPHRASTPLELFFDLVFVVAIAFAASALHHDIAENHIRHGIGSYLLVFFGIWWAWVNFTWFASAFDSGDIPYTLLVFVQMAGALILAAGVPEAFEERDFTITVLGYVVMRLALVAQWVRAAYQDPVHRQTALRFAIGIAIAQAGWLAWNFLLDGRPVWLFVPLAIFELLIPVWAEQAEGTHWHPEHIVERYGLFTIIVLGESVLAGSLAMQTIEDLHELTWELAGIIGGGLLILFSMWWLYFEFRDETGPASRERTFIWSYGHYFIWAATAAVGVGISVAVDYATDHAELSQFEAGAALAIPVVVFLVSMWIFHDLPGSHVRAEYWLTPLAAVLVLLTPFTGVATLAMGIVLALLAAARTFLHYWEERGADTLAA